MTDARTHIMASIDKPPELAQRHVLVTGASRGIGAGIAHELAALNARVSLVSRRFDRVETVRLALANPSAHAAFEADVTDERAVAAMVAAVESRMGPVFALVNNAGGGEAMPFAATTGAHWRRMIDANLMSAVFCTRAVLPWMLERREGRVVNVASTAAVRGYRHVSAYAAAKHALLGLTRSLALEVARDGIAVNAVCPGYTETEMLSESIAAAAARTGKSAEEIRARYAASNAGGRLVAPREVARVVAWLCGDAAGALHGTHIMVEGGPLEVSD